MVLALAIGPPAAGFGGDIEMRQPQMGDAKARAESLVGRVVVIPQGQPVGLVRDVVVRDSTPLTVRVPRRFVAIAEDGRVVLDVAVEELADLVEEDAPWAQDRPERESGTMPTLSTILRTNYGFSPSDFGSPDDAVAVDSRRGVLHPLGSDARGVALTGLFREGHFVSSAGDAPFRFVVKGVGSDGLDAVSPEGERGFLPWEMLAAALRASGRFRIETLEDADDTGDGWPRALVGDEIGRLEQEAARHRAAASALDDERDRLESIGRRPTIGRPSSWLGE